MAELQLLVDDVVMKSFVLKKDTILIGRSPDNDIVIDDESVSGEHARIDMIPSQLMEGIIDVFIEDLGSTNGTFVDGIRLQSHHPARLRQGSEVMLGKLHIQIMYRGAQEASSAD